MKRAFTLIELIFVIVIIGLLSAVAVPKFLNLKQNAEANNVVKTTVDAAQQAVEAATNWRDLEDKNFSSDFNLSDIIKLNGKGWTLISSGTMQNNSYEYNDSINNKLVAEINMSRTEVNYSINCMNFNNEQTQKKCAKAIGEGKAGDDNITSVNLKW